MVILHSKALGQVHLPEFSTALDCCLGPVPYSGNTLICGPYTDNLKISMPKDPARSHLHHSYEKTQVHSSSHKLKQQQLNFLPLKILEMKLQHEHSSSLKNTQALNPNCMAETL